MRVYVHSEARQATEEQILQKKCNQFEAALESLNEGLSLPRRLKNIWKVERKVGRLQEKYQSVAHRYAVEVKQKEGTLLAESVTFSARASHQERTPYSRHGAHVRSQTLIRAISSAICGAFSLFSRRKVRKSGLFDRKGIPLTYRCGASNLRADSPLR